MKTTLEVMERVQSAASEGTIPPIVLVVDDHYDTLELYDFALSRRGYWVARAASGLEGLECAQDLRPDAAVIDIGLPGGMTGADLIRELRADRALHDLPVLAVTGRGPDALPSFSGLQISGLLLKPVTPETLARRVENALASSPSLAARVAAAGMQDGTGLSATPAFPTAGPARKADKKRRECPSCGTRLQWVETRRCERTVYDYYLECSGGCGLLCFNRTTRQFEMLLTGDPPIAASPDSRPTP